MPLLSVIIPTFNPGPKLATSIESVQAASKSNAANCEILVQDGLSTDGTPAWLAGHAGQEMKTGPEQTPIFWRSEKDGGIFEAMNRGIARSSGQWLHFLGAGDTLKPDIFNASPLRELLEQKKEDLALIYGDIWLCQENLRYGGPFSPRKLRSWVPSHQAIFYNRRLFDLIGHYETKYPIAADYAFNLACWGDSRIEKIYVPLLICDFEGGGISQQQRDENFERDKLRLIRQRLGFSAYLMRRAEILAPRTLKNWRVALLNRIARN